MERRVFIKDSGLLAGGLLMGSALHKALGDEATGIIKVGVIGCGDRGKGLIHTLNDLPERFKVVAICDVLDFRLTETQKINKAGDWKTYADYHALLDNKEVGAVVVSVPLNMHYPIAVDVLKADKHLYLEKL
jgi:predicted dehydrogenase